MGIRDLLLGENPLDVERLWDKVYEGTIYHGRRGLGIMLMSAIDNALHDLRGKIPSPLPDRGVRHERSPPTPPPQYRAGLARNAPACIALMNSAGVRFSR
jgi:hypothetical protein